MFFRVLLPGSAIPRQPCRAHDRGRAGDANAPRFRDALQWRRETDAVAKNVVAFDQHVAEIDADTVEDALPLPRPVAVGEQLLDRDRALDRRDDGGKLEQQHRRPSS